MAKHSSRQYWLKIHLWLGLVIGFFIAILGISGSLLLLKKPILEWEIGQQALYATPHAQGTLLSSDIWRQQAKNSYPQLNKVMGVAPPNSGFIPATNAMVFGSVAPSNKLAIAFIDPINADAKGFVIFDDLLFAKVVSLHRLLLLPPDIGSWLVLTCGVVLIVSIVSGALLWWPRKNVFSMLVHWKKGLKNGAKWRQWHYFFAIYFTLPLFIIAFSGVLLARPDLFTSLISAQEIKGLVSTLHSEIGLGFFGLLIVFFSGFLLPFLYISGVVIWWKKRRSSALSVNRIKQ
ncbi:PepSY-associated TM helix domain-containing protein [Providencia rettgeri]|jgi:uncharacterized iron-regulated membrane protein|uniref:PepSY-associated TM helix domain-containing protein n=1 Tax=Providencia rettgeri TaxID=587 RepID=UPI002362130A|nr:PepSY-associated TM helix domain-containing protein [Providencia rettgeri]MDR2225450.1 PepSY domain-containing protein [Providencia sp.]